MASSLEILNAARLQFENNPPRLMIAQTSVQALASSAIVTLTWQAPTFDNYTMWAVGNPTRVTPKVSGTYLVIATASYQPNATGGRNCSIVKNGVTNVVTTSSGNATVSFNSNQQCSGFVTCNGSTDYFEVQADQNSGVSLNTVVALTSMFVVYVSA